MNNFKFRLRTRIRHRMKLNKRVIDFNKEILIGEIGAILGAPIFGFLGSLIFTNSKFISFATLFGSILGGSISWLVARIYDEKKSKRFSVGKFAREVTFFTPVAFLISISASYPTVLFVTNSVFLRSHISFLSSLVGEICGFSIFLLLINSYRIVLGHYFNKKL